MKVLIDECAPKARKTFLTELGHDCSTVQEAGWSGVSYAVFVSPPSIVMRAVERLPALQRVGLHPRLPL